MTDKLIALVHSHITSTKNNPKLRPTNRIIISLCCGRSETEMQSPASDLCICLDVDKRSLYASAFTHKYLHRNRANLLFHHFDMSKGLFQLIKSLSSHVNVQISVLFQHPSPSPETRNINAISAAVADCIEALMTDLISTCHFVYDCHKLDNKRIQSLCNLNIPIKYREYIVVSSASLISLLGENKVNHPLFGMIRRVGWAKMKGGEEWCFLMRKKGI